MSGQLKVAIGQHSSAGRKECNQDFHGVCVPPEPQLSSRGIAIALADGISSSSVSQVASQAAVTTFLEDYYCTSDSWSVKTSVERIVNATNSWLHSQGQRSQYRYDKDRGYVCTLSAMVLKSNTAYLFHIGDSRIYRIRGNDCEQLTSDHRVQVATDQSYLSRALGVHPRVEIDYQTAQMEAGDVFVLATDGVYDHVEPKTMVQAVHDGLDDLDAAAQAIVRQAYEHGSTDNLTLQLVRVDELPSAAAGELHQQASQLPFPPVLSPRDEIDGYRITRELHGSSRSHIYLAVDGEDNALVSIKVPSIDLRDDPAYLERFLTEEWVARRIDSPHVLKPRPPQRKRNFIYVVSEYIEGQTLAQWMVDNPRPPLEAVRAIVDQIARGLRAFHRLDMLHQDLRPDNVMIDRGGTVKIIDFGSTRVAGIVEGAAPDSTDAILGTAQYTAPEYFLGEAGSAQSDLFSLGVISYQMLTGRLPYGTEVAKSRTRAAQNKLAYRTVLADDREIPAWIDAVLRKAVHPDPARRYQEVAEFAWALRHPNPEVLTGKPTPLIERNPLLFWKGLCLLLGVVVVVLIGLLTTAR